MEKLYKLLRWLDMEQAVNWLQDLTGTPITSSDLLRLCNASWCSVYVDVHGLEGTGYDDFESAVLEGVHRVCVPSDMKEPVDGEYTRSIETSGKSVGRKTLTDWHIENFPIMERGACFKPADIQALADKMNGAAVQPRASSAELNDLHQQFEQEHVARLRESRQQGVKESEARLAEDLLTTLMAAEKKLEQERTARQAAEAKAEKLQESLRIESEIAKTSYEHMESLRQDLKEIITANEAAQQEVVALREALDNAKKKQLDPRERATFERLLYVLASQAKYNLQNPFSDETSIQLAAGIQGIKGLDGKGTVAKNLKAAAARAEKDQKNSHP